jgi:hypothetical protein
VLVSFLVVVLSIPVGGVVGGFLGLVATTFIPQCCTDTGCHNCFEFMGMVGYEATGYLGFWFGLVVFPLICTVFILYWLRKNSLLNDIKM